MKAITVKQPWASLICGGVKDVENRTWKTNYRGRILVHAASTDFDFSKSMTSEYQRYYIKSVQKPYIHSAIIGSVCIVDCIKSVDDNYEPWGGLYCYHWKLANPELFPEPIPCKGKLSLWDYPGIPEPEFDEDGHRICMCTMDVKEEAQVIRMIDHFECRYCGGRWYR